MVEKKFLPTWYGAFMQGKDDGKLDGFMTVVEEMQRMISNEGEYVMGKEFTIADICVAPALGRIWVALENDLGKYGVGEGRKVYEKLKGEEKYERIRRYVDKIRERESFKSTFDEVSTRLGYLLGDGELKLLFVGVCERGNEDTAQPTMRTVSTIQSE
jgi:hypothetical protein